ncbi:MAG: Transcriptional regulator, TetR family protein [Myxococcaceae bacterium]|nr:Transcriptional regulator, TetR family protein [Myxococcaceae bacterium]
MAAKKRAKSSTRKPVQPRAQATRDAILKAAAQLLSRAGGYGQLTTNHIAQRAGVSIGTVYEYFGDKESIVRAITEAHVAQGEQLITTRALQLACCCAQLSKRQLVAALVDIMLALHRDDPMLHRVLATVPHGRATLARIHALGEQSVSFVAELLAVHPEIRVRNPQLSARLIVDTLDALTHRWVVDAAGEPLPVDELAGELTHMLARYLDS